MKTTTDPSERPDEDTYAGSRSENEYSRLRLQHEFIKYTMAGELVLAPIDFRKSGLRVLDSATGDGYWLVDLAAQLGPTNELVGADIAPQHFIPTDELPANISLRTHNIFESWPADMQKTFDLVHQRFVLMACNDANSVEAIRYLGECVKPGGWIQLHDGDMQTIEDGPMHPAMERFREIVRTGFRMMGFNLSPGPKLVKWLTEAGFANVEERILTIKCGKSSADANQGEKVTKMLLAVLENMIGLSQNVPGFPYSMQEIQDLKPELEAELSLVGNHYKTHVVWAQKPF
ncbi:S-adenosyl-L-methionine-dependent methyltransferase [Pleomassaria siparia CBS 279.74]|uniref:S-adenosyl-L-methionine-dependent methyltransferase n=1 Tax=Pleomassaria siparia CBS 279.74 TaxID=1314801 RepID=A0A6G1KFL0_9PLEO|nr:S-adenosyl-L-methionine-dependent methyltransferase [Pleomassaria siparia CBS 279.74]